MLDPGTHLTGVVALFMAGVVAAKTSGQTPGPTPGPIPPAVIVPAPLLREGTFMLQARGSLQRGEQPGVWVFRIAPGDPGREMSELTLMPCTLLASLEQLVESMPDERIVFDLTGQVFVYRGRNFLMPTHAPRLVDYVPPSRPDERAAPADSAEAILRDLDETIGPLVHSPRRSASDATRQPIAPGGQVLWRHGWMVREPGGAWSFVFGADATGLSDPPMVLLPCRMLEDMERHAMRSSPDKPLLVSGRVTRYRSRNYMLPTMFRIPRYTSALRP